MEYLYFIAALGILVLIVWSAALKIQLWALKKEHKKAVKHNEESLNFKP